MSEQWSPFDENDDGIALTGEQDTIPRGLLDQAPSIERLRGRFDQARQDPGEGRIKSMRCRDYFDGPRQLDSDIRETLRLRGQPPIYTNRVRPAINGILGILEASRSDPRAYPRNPNDDNAADIATKVLRFIADECDFAETKQDVAENFLIEGTGACIVEMDGDDIVATQIRWEEFYYDPYSRKNDFSDARFMGVAKWMDATQVRERWAIRINEIGDPMAPQGAGIIGDSWQDKPESMAWIDSRRQRMMLVEEYHIADGRWMRCVYVATGVLEYDVSPYVDDKNRPCNPIEAVSCYVTGGSQFDNVRYSPVLDMIPIQDEINASRSRSLHLMNSRQVQKIDQAAPPVDDVIVRQEAAKADGVIPAGWQIVQHNDVTQANMARMQEAKSEIERMGPTPAVLGRQGETSQSGRARLVLQQAGMTELARPMARLSNWELRVYRQMFNRARQFKTDPWWIRITDEVKAPEYMQVNEPVMGMVMQPAAGPDGQPLIDPASGQPAMMPAIGVIGYEKRLSELDVDIILDTTPDTANLQQEVFADLKEAVVGGLDIFGPQFEILLEMSPLANKADVLERLKAAKEQMAEAQQQQAQMQERVQQIGEAGAIADIRKTDAETRKVEAETESREADTLISALQATGIAPEAA